jgi:hypothetical protein
LGARKREMREREFLFIYSASSFVLVLLSASLKIGIGSVHYRSIVIILTIFTASKKSNTFNVAKLSQPNYQKIREKK